MLLGPQCLAMLFWHVLMTVENRGSRRKGKVSLNKNPVRLECCSDYDLGWLIQTPKSVGEYKMAQQERT